MSASLFLAAPPPSEAPKHILHLLVPLLKFGHGVPAIAGLLVVVLLVSYPFFKLAHMRPA